MALATRKISYSCLLAVLVFACGTGVALGDLTPLTIDQQNPGPGDGTNGVSEAFTVGQSFTPTLSAIDAVEFSLWSGSSTTTAMVQLRNGVDGEDGLDGTVIGTSGSVTFSSSSPEMFYRFEFPDTITLTPSQTYVAELVVTAGGLGLAIDTTNAYGGGQYFATNCPPSWFTYYDMVFREGVYAAPVPVPGAVLLGMLGLGVAGMRLRRLA